MHFFLSPFSLRDWRTDIHSAINSAAGVKVKKEEEEEEDEEEEYIQD
jgi:hypothetical protein